MRIWCVCFELCWGSFVIDSLSYFSLSRIGILLEREPLKMVKFAKKYYFIGGHHIFFIDLGRIKNTFNLVHDAQLSKFVLRTCITFHHNTYQVTKSNPVKKLQWNLTMRKN